LKTLFPAYLRDEGALEGDFDDALRDARVSVGRYQHLLEPLPDHTYAPYDRLVYHFDEPAVRDTYPMLEPAWKEARGLCGTDLASLMAVGGAAYLRKNSRVAEAAMRTGMALGHGGAAHNLGLLLKEQGKTEEAEQAYRTGMALGSGGAAHNLGLLLKEQGKTEEAEAAFRKGIELGQGLAAWGLGCMVAQRGQLEDAATHVCLALEMTGKGLEDEPFVEALPSLADAIGAEAYDQLMALIAAKRAEEPAR
jgi:tetratricopeptide (TPR) repeat protein